MSGTRMRIAVAGVACALIGAGGDVAFDRSVEPAHEAHATGYAQPEWLVEEMRKLANDDDRWITDNSAYRSDTEPWEQYGIEWSWAEDGNGLTGRLFGLMDGEDRATFWEMRMSWDEEAQAARIWQRSGDGTVGDGTMRTTGNGIETEAIQTFTAPDGTTTRIRHVSTTTDDTHTTRSFDRVDDDWQPRRMYVWKKLPR
jgi:hypothetical protein